jgi:hypothetical protein
MWHYENHTVLALSRMSEDIARSVPLSSIANPGDARGADSGSVTANPFSILNLYRAAPEETEVPWHTRPRVFLQSSRGMRRRPSAEKYPADFSNTATVDVD